MNASQLVQQIIEDPMFLKTLSPDEGTALVPSFVQAFNEHKLWPQDAASVIAECSPTDEQLLGLLQSNCERSQKLGLHIISQLIETENDKLRVRTILAQEVLRLLQTDSFRPKRKGMRGLWGWAESSSIGMDIKKPIAS
ncbi:hypothetical protein [Bremerella alba]|uniref:Uncharacterized protein n=1 Tax=Bremerella alba TaxID=980252 RepID=A0A7V9A5T3_9BACT|nr:hypothetical protein [Bremerella alba]MBA2113690.1 hypothetical protein [Bremerella alba]